MGALKAGVESMNIPDVERNLVLDFWSADREGALPELGPCSHDDNCISCRGTELFN